LTQCFALSNSNSLPSPVTNFLSPDFHLKFLLNISKSKAVACLM